MLSIKSLRVLIFSLLLVNLTFGASGFEIDYGGGWIGNGSWLTIYLSLAASYRARLVRLAMVRGFLP